MTGGAATDERQLAATYECGWTLLLLHDLPAASDALVGRRASAATLRRPTAAAAAAVGRWR